MTLPASPAVPRRVVVHPGGLAGQVEVPGDKSIGHRALIIGALADGPCDLSGLPASEDVLATAAAVAAMGARVQLDHARGGLAGEVVGPLTSPAEIIDCGNSGTALRLLAGVAAGIDGATTLTGDESLRARPMGRISTPLRELGAQVEGPEGATLAPLTVRGVIRDGGHHRSELASAQVKSAILLAAVRARVAVTVEAPASRDHTERMLRHLGADIDFDTAPGSSPDAAAPTSAIHLRAGMPRAAPISVPGDPSSAAFWWVAAAVAGSAVATPGVGAAPGRTGALAALEDLGARVSVLASRLACDEPVADVEVASSGLTGASVLAAGGVVSAIDELPILAVAGAVSEGGLTVRDAAELRVKESDRIAALERLFAALGMTMEGRPDGFHVPGGQCPRGGTFDAGLDHRLAMSAAIAATVARGPVTIDGFASTGSSYPTFLADFEALGGQFEVVA